MIDKQMFAEGMGLLAGAFNRTIDPPVSRMYYAVLSAKLSTEEFERAVSLIVAEETFWPSPAAILAKVAPNDTERGFLAFEHVNRVVGDAGGHRFFSHERFHAEFDAPTRVAIAAVGGLAEIGNTPTERWTALERRFAKAYTTALLPALPQSPTDGRVMQLVESVSSERSMPGVPSRARRQK